MRTAIKKVRAAIGHKDGAAAREALGTAVRLIDRAGLRGTIKKGTASRSVSRLSIAVNGLKA
jgi:ribosomal protein S20